MKMTVWVDNVMLGHMKKLFKWLLLLVGVLTVGIAIFLFNPGLAKGPLENYLSKITGYSISLDGELKINVGRRATLTASDVRMSSMTRVGTGELLSLGELTLTLDLASLFEDIIVIETLLVNDLKLNLQTNTEGLGNWVPAPTPPSPEKAVTEGAVVIFRDVTLSNTHVGYLNGETGKEQVLQIDRLHQHQKDDGMLHINLDGSLNQRPLEFTGSVGPYANLLNGQNINYSGSGHFGSLDIVAEGLIDDLTGPKRPQFNIELQGPNIDDITSMFGTEDLGAGQFSLIARGREVDGHYEAGIHGSIGDISLAITAQASDYLQVDEVDLKLAINGPSLAALTRTFGIENWPDKPFSLKGDIKRVGTTLNVSELTLSIGGTQLMLEALLSDFPHLDAARIKLSIQGDDVKQFRDLLGVSGIASGPFEIHGNLDVSPDSVELIQVEFKTSVGQATISGSLGPAPDYIGTKLHVHLEGHNANQVISIFGIDALPEQPFNLDAHIERTKEGLVISRGVLVSIEDDRLELGGLVALNPGAEGTDIEVNLSGDNLPEMLSRLVGDFRMPAEPYALSGRILLQQDSIKLQNVKAEFEDINLTGDGEIIFGERLEGTSFSFRLEGDDLSGLQKFPVTGNSMAVFVPGQAYRVEGKFQIEEPGWRLNDISGQLGKATFNLHGLVSPQAGWAGSNINFSMQSLDLNTLFVDISEAGLPPGPFETSGQFGLSADQLTIHGFKFETANARGVIDLDVGWPIEDTINGSFDVNISGDDIRHLLPGNETFKPAKAAFKIETSGQQRGDVLSLNRLDATIGNLQVLMNGKVDEDPNDKKFAVTVSAISTDLSKLGLLNGEPLPAMALDISTSVEGSGRRFDLHDLDATLGDSHIAGSIDLSFEGPRPAINMTLASSYIDVRPFIELVESDEEDAAPKNSTRVIPPAPLPLEAISAFNGNFILNIKQLRLEKDSLHNIVLQAKLLDGHLNIPQLMLEGPRGKSQAALSINPTTLGKARVTVDLVSEKLVLNITGQPDQKLDEAPAFDLVLRVNGAGSNLQQVAGSLNGSVYMGTTGGTLEGVNLSVLDTFILDEIFALVMPKSEATNNLDLRCGAAILEIKNGMVKTNPAVTFITDQITMVSKGTVNLKTEEMKLNFTATPNNALKISASELFNPYILVGGTLSEPAVGLDPAKVLLHGGAAIGTAGISILAKGVLDRVSTTIPLCEDMLKEIQQKK